MKTTPLSNVFSAAFSKCSQTLFVLMFAFLIIPEINSQTVIQPMMGALTPAHPINLNTTAVPESRTDRPQAQDDRCGTVLHNQKLHEKYDIPSIEDFEQWMTNEQKLQKSQSRSRSVITIPVVVHVIHNGQAIGGLPNISDAQIQSQIDVLNEDFRRLNTDAANTPCAE